MLLSLGLTLLGVVSLLALPLLIARLPDDYFARTPQALERGSVHWFLRISKNLLGSILLLLGVLMLVLPGQGLLTILIAVILLDFPGKRRCEIWLVRRPHVLNVLNRLRRRAHRPPLTLEPGSPPQID